MGSPQVENGYLKIANELFEALIRIRIPGEARQMLDLIIRKTYGHNKKTDRISTTQIMEATTLNRRSVYKARRKLKEMNLITVSEKGESCIVTYAINKHYKTWRLPPKKERRERGYLQKRSLVSPKKETNCLPESDTQKTKDTITKEKNPAHSAATFEQPVDNSRQVDLQDITIAGQTESVKHKIYNQVLALFQERGWKTDPEYLKNVFRNIVQEMDGYNPKEFFPYFRKVANNHVNRNAELYAADARIQRGKEHKIGLTVAGVSI